MVHIYDNLHVTCSYLGITFKNIELFLHRYRLFLLVRCCSRNYNINHFSRQIKAHMLK